MIPRQIIQKIRQIEIRTKHLVNDVFSGEYHSVFKGRGMEFAEVREYEPGDEIRSIDWNVTARLGRPYIKRFIEERELTVILMADVSASGHFGTVNQMKSEITAEICALLAYAAIQNNDRVGLLMFTDQIEKYIPPKKGRTHILRVIREVLYNQPGHTGTDLTQALEYLNRLLTRRSIVFILSDFLTEDYMKPLRVASKRHDVVAVTITDPRELSLPSVGLIELQDAETGEEVLVDTGDAGWRRQYAEYNEALRKARDQQFRVTGVDAIHIRTDEPYIDPLLQFFKLRERKFAR
ncbi:MAG: DUF58 domain-containing protein [Gemmatimonadetes bacterium]|nr:DUF58 domain-containing protein [Gemmatimonadota bacterium]MYA77688.1 DUF58 domain-containing protein [Gemmatimonadota bacterium]MYG15946.1 DUF58 domain-containing protein [Gemmatimonadota bacterium]MYH17918.1 DUF58 domain-containing protein [Gemmatimonadota bacterium]MYK97981.1 DUF58 domain-containing protein [Gemmatimonadota bacterium]